MVVVVTQVQRAGARGFTRRGMATVHLKKRKKKKRARTPNARHAAVPVAMRVAEELKVPASTADGKSRKQPLPPSYHFVFSPGFGHKYVTTLLLLSVLYGAVRHTPALLDWVTSLYESTIIRMMRVAHSLTWWSVIALLSSSCCAFQLVLNVFSVGCAGFNTVLGPFRPYLMAMATWGQVWMWASMEKQLQYSAAKWSTLVTLLLSFLPELVFLSSMMTDQMYAENGANQVGGHRVDLTIQGMGCVACVETIKNAIRTFPPARPGTATVFLATGKASVVFETQANGRGAPDALASQLADKITGLGFPATAACTLGSDP